MRLLSSLSHQEGVEGTTSVLRRERIVGSDGAVTDVPVVSGNAWRGQLRDATMRALVRSLGDPPLSLAAFHFLFSGGSLTATGPYVDIGFARELRSTIPSVAVFGGAVGNHILRGKLKVGKLYPICRETLHLLHASAIPDGYTPPSIWELVQEESYTRTDDEGREDLRALIDPMQRLVLEADTAARAAKKKAGEPEIASRDSQQMRYHVETLAAGTLLSADLVLEDYTPEEFGALVSGLVEWSRDPSIGGKRATGHGRVEARFTDWQTVRPQLVGDGLVVSDDGAYERHVIGERAAILRLLGRLS